MITKYNTEIDNEIICKNIEKLTNKVFKLLPSKEEDLEWRLPLKSIIMELSGMDSLFQDQTDIFPVICKLESLLVLEEDDFFEFRRTIFECLGLLNKIKNEFR